MLDEKTLLPKEGEAIASRVSKRTFDLSPNSCIHHLIEAQAERSPDAIAIAAPERTPLTYRRLRNHIGDIVATLNAIGVGRNDCAAIVLPNGPEMAVAFLAVAAGATSAPLNRAYRANEFDFYLSDLNAKALIIQSGNASPARAVAKARGIPIIELSPVLEAEAGIFTLTGGEPSRPALDGFAQPDDVALVLHTSGTTSRPKMVPLTQTNICTSAHNIALSLELVERDRCLNVMPLFHIHGLIGALLSSLTAGASVVCTPGFYAPKFFEWLAEFRPTWYTAVPTMHQAILARATANRQTIARCPLRLLRSSSAPLPPQVMAELEEVFDAPVIESYGMTKASHQIASNPLPPHKRKPGSVGVAAGPEVVIMDEAGNLLPPGEIGEIAIRGANVTPGYKNNPTTNESAFTNGWFRTGDQGHLDTDGYLLITGRIKEIINRGGEKISPREVDEVLLDHPAVAQAVTFAVPHTKLGEDVAAAVVLREHASATEKEIQEFAARRLADFKVPRQVIFVDEIPKGPTGKLQRIGLAEKLGLLTASEQAEPLVAFTAVRTPVEEKLAQIWSEVLGVEQVGVHDNFFHLGGDSILAAQILNRVREAMEVELSFLALFETPTVASMAKSIETALLSQQALPSLSIQPIPRHGELPLSYAQQRMWFLDQLQPGNPAYNRPATIRLAGPINVAALEQSLNEIVRRHEVLRTTFPGVDGRSLQVIAPTLTLTLPVVNLIDLPEAEREAEVRRLAVEEAQRPFDLAQGPLLRATLLRLSEEEHLLLLTMHHIVFDGWSVGVLLRELAALYCQAGKPNPRAFSTGKLSPLSELPIQYADFAVWQRQWLQGETLESQLAYWKQQLSGSLPVLALPTDRPRPAVQTFRGAAQSLVLPKTLSESLKTLSQREEVTLFMTLLAAFGTLLYRYTGQDDIVVGSLIAGRNRVETEKLIGVFINTLVLRTHLNGNPTFRELLGRVREVALGAYAHQDLPFEKLVEELQPERDLSRTLLFQVMFQLRNFSNEVVDVQGLRMEEFDFDRGTVMLDLALEMVDKPEGLSCLFKYSTDLFDATTIIRMAGHFQTLLEGIVVNLEQRVSEFPLLTATERSFVAPNPSPVQSSVESNKTMHVQEQFSCFIFGEGTLPIQCAEILLEQGHQIFGIISPDASISDWAKGKGIPHIQTPDNLIAFLSQKPFDYLFSIANNNLLPKEILELPRKVAINYHDAPLPRYAGVNATSWALMHQEKTHGVTWHVMSNLVDGGDILKQLTLDIADKETAFTLNVKCYEAAIHSFAQLIKELGFNQALVSKQNLDERTYFSRYSRPSAGGAISFNCCARDIDALVRALDFGPYPNPLALPKLAFGSDVIVVSKLEVLDDLSNSLPGTVTAISQSFLKVSTASYEIALLKVLTINGQTLSIPDLVARFGLQVGSRFKNVEPENARRIEAFDALIAKHEAFWVERLATLEPIAIPYVVRTASHSKQKRYANVLMPVPYEVITFLEERYPAWNQSDFLLAAFAAYLARIGGTYCFDIGFRDVSLQRELVGLEGFFASHVPCRLNVGDEQSFEEFFEAVREQVELTKLHFTYARDTVARYPALSSVPELLSENIFPVIIERVERLDDHKASLGNELTLVIPEDGKECCWLYDAEALDGDSVARMLRQFATFLQGIVSDIAQPIAYLPMLSEEERHKILVEWNDANPPYPPSEEGGQKLLRFTQVDYPKDACIHALFETQVQRTPDAVAVVFEDQQLTYWELNARANQLAHYLQSLGVGPEVLVGICVERSLEMVVGILGVLKAGGAYVPLDPTYPQERLTFMLSDTQAPVLLTQQRLEAELPQQFAKVVCLDADWETIAQSRKDYPSSGVRADNLAYVIYTSGSTGRPKGVSVIHRGVVRLVKGTTYANLSAEEVFLQLAPISFDASTFEIWGCLLNGARLVVMPPHTPSLQELGHALGRYQVTTLWLTAGLFHLMVDEQLEDLKNVRQLLAGGDILSVPHVQKLLQELKGLRLINGYGPTESTTFTCCYPITDSSQVRTCVSIGRPIANTRCFLLDSHLQPVPVGVPGDLYIGGEGLARGYLNCPDLTAERFIPNPFNDEPGSRLYKTGDNARYLPDGNIEFLGRIDHQVKIRGFRIELGEIEAVLAGHPAVLQTVVIAREDVPGDKRLVAYLVPNQEPAPTISDLRRFLKQQLPEYMVPNAFVMLDTLPLTPNGKVDRRALPAPEIARSELSRTFVAPTTAIEEMLAQIWAEVLGIEPVGIHDNFFEYGGHSLLATQLVSRVQTTCSVELPLRSLFEAPTVKGLAECIETARKQGQELLAPPLLPMAREQAIPLSFAQARLWFLDKLQPDSAVYNIPAAVRLEGRLNVLALEHSLNSIISRHEALRTNFATQDGQPVQVIHPALTLRLPVVDLRSLPESERESSTVRLATKEAQRPFDLTQECLVRTTLLKLGEAEHVLLLTMHHIISDGWSLGVFVRELAAFYEAFCNDLPSPLPELPIQYADFAVWQRQWLQGDVLESQLAYWKQQLNGAPALLELPTDRPRRAHQTFRGAHQSLALPKELRQALTSLSRREGVTLFMTLLAAFQTLLYRYTEQSDILVGTPIANRNLAQIEGLIGFFVNTLVLRTDLSGNPSFRELLSRVREVAFGAYAHQDVPFEQLVEALQPARDLSHTPLFQVMFVLQNAPMPSLEVLGLTLSPLAVESTTAKFDLTLSLENTEQGLTGSLEYNTDLFDAATITRMLRHFQTMLEGIVVNPNLRLSDLPLLSATSRHQLLVEWNDTQADYPLNVCIHQLFEAQVTRSPDRVAVVFEEQQLTYLELNCRANKIAHHLRSLGVGPDVLVGICVTRSLEMVVGLLGILKAGGAYVPLDPAYPQERLAFMLEDASVPVLLTQQRLVSKLQAHGAKMVCLDTDWDAIAFQCESNPVSSVSADNLAYVIYTSGSTGKPKGVAIEHHSTVALLDWARATFAPEHLAGVLASTSICFDLSVFELFVPLSWGGKVILAENALHLPTLPAAKDVTLINTVPSAIAELLRVDGVPVSVRTVNLAGEPLQNRLLQQLYEQDTIQQVFNLYGPSEDTTYSTFALVKRGTSSSPTIGRPIANTQIYILDSNLQPVPVGVSGELHIGGDGLARGYLNRPELTTQRFITNPFSDKPSARLYKTGDNARYLADGNIEYIGRIDHQVKIRGFRIELGEIEAVLAGHPAVLQTVVIAREDGRGNKRLVAYLVPQHETAPTITDLRCFLKQQLPEYMVPNAFVMLEALPLTPNGKVDRRLLPVPDTSHRSLEAGFVPPRTPTEEVLAGIWAEVLRVEVGIHDNFFELGGHSLLATQVISRVRSAFGVELPLRCLFESPTVAELGEAVAAIRHQNPGLMLPAIKPVPRSGELPLSFAQARLWFLDQLEGKSATYNMPVAVHLTGPFNVHALEMAVQEIVRRHEVLRTTFPIVNGSPMQAIAHLTTVKKVPVVDLQPLPEVEQADEVRRLATSEAGRSFDLANGPLLRVTLLRLGAESHVLLVTMHHIISDGWSMGIFIRELATLYEASSKGAPSPLPELPIQYADFAVWQRQWLSGEMLETQLTYWKQQLAGAPPLLELPTDRPRPPSHTFRGGTEHVQLNPELTRRLLTLSQQSGATLFITLLAAFVILLSRYSGQEDIVVGSPIANRNRSETESLIGFFVNTLVLRTHLDGNPSFRELLRRVREVALGAYAHQDLPFEKLVEELQPERDLSRTPLFQVWFNMLNVADNRLELSGLTVESLSISDPPSKFDLTLYVREQNESIGLKLVYNADLFAPERMVEMLAQFKHLLLQIVEHPEEKITRFSLVTPKAELLLPNPSQALAAKCEEAVHTHFSQQARRIPEKVAVVDAQVAWTYKELEERANQLANYLLENGIQCQDVVAIYGHRSAFLVWAILGVLKAGAAFAILDPAYPASRLIDCLRVASPRGWLQIEAARELPEALEKCVASLSCCCSLQLPQHSTAEVHDLLTSYSTNDPALAVDPDNLAYVAFTSGSTGTPKGILGTLRPLSHFLQWHCQTFGLNQSDRFSMLSGLSHDPLLRDIFTPLCLGATLCIPDQKDIETPGQLADWMQQQKVSITHLTPAMGQLLTETTPAASTVTGEISSLRYVFFGGDVLTKHDVTRIRKLAPTATCVNFYGATETPQVMGYFIITDSEDKVEDGEPGCLKESIPLGRGIEDTQLLVLNTTQHLAGIGEVGEIYVHTPYLSKGYIGDEGLTQQRFVTNPFTQIIGDRLYKTGDFARYLPDGNIEFLGRIDHQVKIRGFRIELGEVEAVLSQHPAVRENVVIAWEEIPLDKRLVAYVVPNQEQVPTISELHRFLKQKLPAYMVPSAFVILDTLPLTPNGKIDRRALPAPDQARLELESTFVTPRTPVEEVLAGIWAEVLGLEQVGIHDDFFELGGHSLLATQVISRLRNAFGVELPLRSLFEAPTVAGLALVIAQSLTEKAEHEEMVSMLAELEGLSDEEAQQLLADEMQQRRNGGSNTLASGSL